MAEALCTQPEERHRSVVVFADDQEAISPFMVQPVLLVEGRCIHGKIGVGIMGIEVASDLVAQYAD